MTSFLQNRILIYVGNNKSYGNGSTYTNRKVLEVKKQNPSNRLVEYLWKVHRDKRHNETGVRDGC